jgi:DNA-binding MarR family transcriptional regulator
MRQREQDVATKTSVDELVAFELATRDLVGVALRSVDQVEVSLPQFRLLMVLQQSGRSTSTECAKALGVVGSSVTRLADRLHASGHLLRGADPLNRSVVTLELTTQGRKLVRQVTARRRRELSRVLDRIDPAERAACATVLRTLHERFGDDDQHNSMPLWGRALGLGCTTITRSPPGSHPSTKVSSPSVRKYVAGSYARRRSAIRSNSAKLSVVHVRYRIPVAPTPGRRAGPLEYK